MSNVDWISFDKINTVKVHRLELYKSQEIFWKYLRMLATEGSTSQKTKPLLTG